MLRQSSVKKKFQLAVISFQWGPLSSFEHDKHHFHPGTVPCWDCSYSFISQFCIRYAAGSQIRYTPTSMSNTITNVTFIELLCHIPCLESQQTHSWRDLCHPQQLEKWLNTFVMGILLLCYCYNLDVPFICSSSELWDSREIVEKCWYLDEFGSISMSNVCWKQYPV